jgi:hypothetical protein
MAASLPSESDDLLITAPSHCPHGKADYQRERPAIQDVLSISYSVW